MIVLLAALAGEAAGLRRRMTLAPERVTDIGVPAHTGTYRGRPVLLAWTGMGRQQAEAGAVAVLACHPAAAVISIGFSGSLDGQLAVGDLVLASEPVSYTHLTLPTN